MVEALWLGVRCRLEEERGKEEKSVWGEGRDIDRESSRGFGGVLILLVGRGC